ncbi:MAG: hypothetical protein KF849_15880 [Rhizobiaceae bacterium]|nr:hypothetical protein [Rhizobiaceae bacterium]
MTGRLSAALGALLLLFAAALPARAEPVLLVDEPLVMQRLSEKGFGFGGLFGQWDTADLAALYAHAPAYRAVVDTIEADIGALRLDISKAGRSLHEFAKSETGRVMDIRWLKAPEAELRLVGVVNRLDRRDFHDLRGEHGCGEVRFVYRLAYAFRKDGKGKVLSSRMPFNFNAVYDVLPDADGGCRQAAARWRLGEGERASADWLAGGVADPSELLFRQLELNAQVVRFPSGQEPEFGGQAVYLMRIFGIGDDTVTELPLENTPDLARLKQDAALKAELADYVAENVAAVDEGVYVIPDRFLATKIISVSTFGGARQANHPFAELFSPDDFAGLHFDDGRLLRSPEGLVARLDNGTCQGCHQSGGTAGFHLIGLDDDRTSPLNRIEVGISPHLDAELPRRAAYAVAVEAGREPDRFRPLSFAPPADWTEGGHEYVEAAPTMPCIADADADKLAGAWACGGGTVCTPLAASDGATLTVAQCLMPPKSQSMFSGHPCLEGEVTSSDVVPFADRYALTQFAAHAPKASARDYTCRPPRIGVPGGMAYRQCDEKDRAFAAFGKGGEMPNEICGLTGGKKFDLCVSSGNFDGCLAGAVQRGNRAACSADHFCRDDYICQAFPPDTPNVKKLDGVGFCSPTYFLFQMRIDNHTTPWPARGRVETYRSVEVDGDPDEQW